MLGHYENECTFHAVECTRCDEEILHRDLSLHYTAGCSAPVSSARTENPSPECAALTLQEVNAALEELKTLVRGPNDDQMLPAVQSQVNELAKQGSETATALQKSAVDRVAYFHENLLEHNAVTQMEDRTEQDTKEAKAEPVRTRPQREKSAGGRRVSSL
ncbi:hypothetical protein HPB52_006795 [Rhipicephalus sanguineus]|uniref:TRAF-type domain-containing protein n=1 Tax=Rhipicephalus sanguineus TaxID=34632 RepID=A0A9D4QE13_RHISA|nr:hypothetical protein HPB52_006795 [Rhipicephalus sanguineus]